MRPCVRLLKEKQRDYCEARVHGTCFEVCYSVTVGKVFTLSSFLFRYFQHVARWEARTGRLSKIRQTSKIKKKQKT